MSEQPTTNSPVVRVSHHYVPPCLNPGGCLEIIGDREMLRKSDKLELLQDSRTYRLTEEWQPGNFNKELYR